MVLINRIFLQRTLAVPVLLLHSFAIEVSKEQQLLVCCSHTLTAWRQHCSSAGPPGFAALQQLLCVSVVLVPTLPLFPAAPLWLSLTLRRHIELAELHYLVLQVVPFHLSWSP